MEKIILTGDRPTGRLHVGHYVGSLKRRVELQNTGNFDDIFIMIADAQALTDNADNPEKVRQNIVEVALDYLSCGLDPEKNCLYYQSHVSGHAELSWILNCFTYMGELNRMTQFKDKAAKHADNINAGLFTYPVLMAADILLSRWERTSYSIWRLQEISHSGSMAYMEMSLLSLSHM